MKASFLTCSSAMNMHPLLNSSAVRSHPDLSISLSFSLFLCPPSRGHQKCPVVTPSSSRSKDGCHSQCSDYLSLLASRSDSRRVKISPSRTGPFTFLMMNRD
eukprot:TRINITY_DN279_c0_g1_i4.p1 TRINITY_DN279_c0_g1~~TRINITY_DN279_c0_g1_i4.p1  ORF type:complete len:102 (-),score=3.25 TRINITY_DN279_c0_g1_i4:310-615(-)